MNFTFNYPQKRWYFSSNKVDIKWKPRIAFRIEKMSSQKIAAKKQHFMSIHMWKKATIIFFMIFVHTFPLFSSTYSLFFVVCIFAVDILTQGIFKEYWKENPSEFFHLECYEFFMYFIAAILDTKNIRHFLDRKRHILLRSYQSNILYLCTCCRSKKSYYEIGYECFGFLYFDSIP